MGSLVVLLDSPQTRLQKDCLSTLVSGHDWDPTTWGSDFGSWVEPVGNRAMLEPGPRNVQWGTSSSGIFSKWGRGDFTLDDSENWIDSSSDASGPFMYYNNMAANASGIGGVTNVALAVNQPICFEMYVQGGVTGNYPLVDLGYSATRDGSVGVSLTVFGGGACNVWKNGAQVGNYSLSGGLFGYYDANQQSFGAAPKGWMQLLLFPCSDRELLMVSPSFGGGFSHVFLDLEEGTPGQVILDAAPFWFQVKAGIYPAHVRVAPIQFASSGTIAGQPSGFRDTPPDGGPDFAYVYQDATSSAAGYVASVAAATSGFPNVNSIPNPVQLQVTMTGGPTTTPYVYGAIAGFNAVTAATATPDGAGEGLDVTDYTVSASVSVDDAIGGRHATIRLRSPAALAALGCEKLDQICDRAFVLQDANGVLGNFVAESPITEEDFGYDDDDYDAATEIELSGRDGWKFAEDYEFGDPLPCDTLSLAQAFYQVCKRIGFDLNISTGANEVIINASGSSAGGEWNYHIDAGERGSDAISKLHQTYIANWWLDLIPDAAGWTLQVTDPSEMPSTSSATLYRSVSDAIDAGLDASVAPYFVYRSFKYHYLEPEASQAWMVGQDFRTGRPIITGTTNDEAADPATAIADRPPNWVGYLKKVSFGTPSLTNMADLQAANELYFNRVTASRMIVEFECEYLDGVSRGDIVTLKDAMGYSPSSGGVDIDVRLKTFSGSYVMVAGGGAQWRPCQYVAEKSDLVCPLGVGGTSIRAIKANWAVRALSKFRFGELQAVTSRRPPINVQGA